MAIRITCPGCKTALTLDDDMRGQKVRCEHCDKALSIPAAGGAKREKELAMQNGAKVKTKAVPKTVVDHPDDDEDESPKKRKKKKKQAGADALTWVLFGGAALFVVGIVGGGVWAVVKFGNKPAQQPEVPVLVARKDEPQDTRSGTRIIVPTRKEGNPAGPQKKGGIAVINNVRGSAWRTERRNELRNIGQYYIQFAEDFKGANRNMMNFKDYIKSAPNTIREPIAEGYYVMNFKADPTRDSKCIIAYERDEDNQGFKGHFAVFGDGSVDYIATPQLKAALGN